jgi:hypothetical protein
MANGRILLDGKIDGGEGDKERTERAGEVFGKTSD